MNRFDELRAQHPTFIYDSFELGDSYIRYHFRMGEFSFDPEWTFDSKLAEGGYSRAQAEYAAFSLGMAELVSYWKCACPPNVEIRCGWLDEAQKRWWKKLYFNGLGEFFYRNSITADPETFMNITAPEPPVGAGEWEPYELSGTLVPVGGGKDSVVTLELLKEANEDITPYIINPRPATVGCVEASGIPTDRIVSPRRAIDRTLLELNSRGYLNGHTPYSSVVAFSALLCGIFLNKKYIALSNESSANETYVEGAEVNHQYSKSTEFESDFRQYCADWFAPCPEYYSLLRPLSEWQIAREFVKYPQYFKVFRSCNLGSKTNVWCCNCAKCLYVYILLAAFLDDDVLIDIFGCDMLEKAEMSDVLDGLMLDGEDKPFECVGTKNEVRLSLAMALGKRADDPPALLERFRTLLPDTGDLYEEFSGFYDRNNFVPNYLLPHIEKRIENEY